MTTKTYNNRYQLNNLSIGTLKQLSYSRDNTGNITAIADNLNPNNTKSYSYDNLHRLTLATGQWGALTYAYDFVGNRTYETTDTGNTTYTYTTNTNKLALTTGEKNLTFNYDNNGNTTAENTKQFIYNQNQRLTRVTDTGTVLGEYLYNGNGQRADKLIPSQNKCTVFHYDKNGLLITESTRTGNIKAEYVYLNGQPLAKIENNNIYYYHNDHLGTPLVMTDSSGSVVWSGEFLPFGEPLTVSGSVTNNLRFPGQYYDSETGLHQNWHRDYKTEIGRYPEADPIGLEGGINLYIYVGNSPCNWIDPLGLDAYMCTKPLDVLGGTGTKSGPDIGGNPAYHQYICVKTGDVTVCGGQSMKDYGGLRDLLPWGKGAHSNDHFDSNRCEEASNNKCIDNCLLKEFNINKPRPNYGLLGPGTNCQEWAEDTFEKCVQECF